MGLRDLNKPNDKDKTMNANQLTDAMLDEMLDEMPLDTSDYSAERDARIQNDELIEILFPDELMI